MSSPHRGGVWLVDLGYVAKVRPCLVISIPATMADRALQNLITIPHTKLLRQLGELDPVQLSEIEDSLLVWLGFEDQPSDDE